MRGARLTIVLIFFAAEIALLAQIGYPPGGQYPGGRYPGGGYPGGGGIPMPGRKQKKTTSKDAPNPDEQLTSVGGKLRSIDEKQLVVEAPDTRIITFKRTARTKFTKDGAEMKPSDLKPGDGLRVEATQDNEGFFFAVNVIFQKEGTAAERAEASKPADVSIQPSTNNSDSDDERPRIRRADSPPPEKQAEAPAQTAPTETATTAPAPAPARRIAVDEPLAPAVPDPDDPGPPTLRRGAPAKRTPPAPRQEVASAKPPASSAPAPAPAPAAREPQAPPVPERRAEDPIIEKAKEAAYSFTETLPNYVCQQFTARFINTSHITSWQAQDVVSAEVVYENGRESYRNLAVNGKPVKKNMEELGGAWSKGEFGTLLRDLFSDSTAAQFRFRRDSTIAGMAAALYDYQVERENSHWSVMAASQTVHPAYKGSVWIDKKNGRVLRIEMQARSIPSEFPLDTVETAADYEYVRIGGTQQFLLPVHSETLSCQRGTNTCARNAIDFRNYKKYSGEATITFDDNK